METTLPLFFVARDGLVSVAVCHSRWLRFRRWYVIAVSRRRREDIMIASIGPFWDANETWIVMGVGVLLVAFPAAHGIILTQLYMPVTVMLLGLILRGVAFDFRVKAGDAKKVMWNQLFFVGSLVAATAQGWMLGSYITGLNGSMTNTVFAILIAFSLPALYVTLGATWLMIKTEGALFAKSVAWARKSVLPMALGLFFVSIATPLVSEVIASRWFQLPNAIGLLPIPVTSIIALTLLTYLLRRNVTQLEQTNPWLLFLCPVVICLMAALGLAYSIFPDIIIGQLTIWDAAAHTSSLQFVFWGVLITLPCIIGYTIFIYRVFSGKATELSYD